MKSYILSSTALMACVLMAASKAGGAPAPVAEAPKFTFDDLPIPAASTRGGVGGAKEASELAQKLDAVPMNKSFLEAVTIPATITDAAERDKAFKAEARKITNRIGGAIRRHRKQDGKALHNFGLRTVNDATLGVGVRVWRVADLEAKATPPAPPAPPPAPPVA